MGNVGRTIYLVIPFATTLLALILLLITLLNLTDATSNSFLESLRFLRVDATDIKANTAGKTFEIKDVGGFYDVGLFRYCSGKAGAALPDHCSDSQLGYAFDPVSEWGGSLNIANLVDKEYTNAINAYRSVSKLTSACYVIGFVALALSLILGLLTFCLSRITNCLTTTVSAIGTVFICIASGAATAMFVTIKGVLYAKLHQYNVKADVGGKVLVITWLAAVAAVVATFFWSCGCCCGKDRHSHAHSNAKRVNSLRARSAYERVPSPMGHPSGNPYGSSVPLQSYNHTSYTPHHGYEPYRGHNAV